MAWEKILNSKIKFADFFDYPFRKQDKLSYLKTYHSISKAVIKIISEEEPEFVIGPMGIGDHTDHVIVNQTLINLKEKHDFTLYLYEDFPYANQEKYYYGNCYGRLPSGVQIHGKSYHDLSCKAGCTAGV